MRLKEIRSWWLSIIITITTIITTTIITIITIITTTTIITITTITTTITTTDGSRISPAPIRRFAPANDRG